MSAPKDSQAAGSAGTQGARVGRRLSPPRLAAKESKRTMEQWLAERETGYRKPRWGPLYFRNTNPNP